MSTDSHTSDNLISLNAIKDISAASDRIINHLQRISHEEMQDDDSPTPIESKVYTLADAARMLGKTTSGIRKAEEAGHIPRLEKMANGRRSKYTLSQINEMRDYWGCRPGRKADDLPIRLSFQNFKGGVGKTTLAVHCAQYLARSGYRVLLVDCDSQGSATVTFGYRPDQEIVGADTLYPYLVGDAENLEYAIKKTRWDGLDLIPACLDLYGAEYHLASQSGEDQTGDWLSHLDDGLQTIEDNYDIVLIDPPPALGMISLSVLRALDGLIIPTPPSMYDFHSTASFFKMLEEVMEQLANLYGSSVDLDFVKILVSKHSDRQAQQYVAEAMRRTFGNNLLQNPFIQSAEIDNASSSWRSVYDLSGPTSSRQTYKRCLESLDTVFGEVEHLLEAVWASRRARKALSTSMPEVSQSETVPDFEIA